jgi:iron-sulfur cluster assembly accessory protein
MSVQVTESAIKELRSIMDENEMPTETAIRMGVKGGGCSGFSYILDFCTEKKEQDFEMEYHGVKVYIDPKSNIFLEGTTLDFNTDLLNRGFVWKNPKATGSCGCGSSFSM